MLETINAPIVPAIIPTSLTYLKDTIEAVSFAHEIQIDVVDGVFVPFSSWPYEPIGSPAEASALIDPYTVEIDLMVEKPIPAALAWHEAGAEMYVFHIETLSVAELEAIGNRMRGRTIGISANNDTPLETLFEYAPFADYFQLMGIRAIGSQGQPFDEAVLERIKLVKDAYPNRIVSIDGSVNVDTLPRLKEAGADRFISGSGILKAETPQKGFEALASVCGC